MKFSFKTKTNYWFKPKKYGYGFYPVTWQGWIAILTFAGLIFLAAYSNGLLINGFESVPTVDAKAIARQIIDTAILTILFQLLFAHQVKGGVKWRWGGK